jgi:hypothetical protein
MSDSLSGDQSIHYHGIPTAALSKKSRRSYSQDLLLLDGADHAGFTFVTETGSPRGRAAVGAATVMAGPSGLDTDTGMVGHGNRHGRGHRHPAPNRTARNGPRRARGART